MAGLSGAKQDQKMKNKVRLFVGMLAICVAVNAAQAATVTWAANGTISGDTDVLAPTGPNQTVVAALGFSYGSGGATPVVNGVTFTNVSNFGYTSNGYNDGTGATGGVPAGATVSSFNLNTATDVYNPNPPAFAALSAAYKSILNASIIGLGNGSSTLVLNNLISGDTYTVRFWTYDGYDGAHSLTITSNGVSSAAASEGSNGGDLGSYLTASFVADSGSQTFSFSNSDSYNPAINAMEVLDTSVVPEPSTVALLSAACGLVGLVAVRRFRLAAV
jgi:hypothetical protein